MTSEARRRKVEVRLMLGQAAEVKKRATGLMGEKWEHLERVWNPKGYLLAPLAI